jgi:hypothetical protein
MAFGQARWGTPRNLVTEAPDLPVVDFVEQEEMMDQLGLEARKRRQ